MATRRKAKLNGAQRETEKRTRAKKKEGEPTMGFTGRALKQVTQATPQPKRGVDAERGWKEPAETATETNEPRRNNRVFKSNE